MYNISKITDLYNLFRKTGMSEVGYGFLGFPGAKRDPREMGLFDPRQSRPRERAYCRRGYLASQELNGCCYIPEKL